MTIQQLIQQFQAKGFTVRVLGVAPRQRVRILNGGKSSTVYEERWVDLTQDEQGTLLGEIEQKLAS